ELQHVLAGGERDALLADPLERAEVTGGWNGDGPGHVGAVDLDAEGAVGEGAARHAKVDVVEPRSSDVDGVDQPLAGLEVVHHEAAPVGIARGDDVDVLGWPVLAARV